MGKKTLLTLGVGLLASAALLLSCSDTTPDVTSVVTSDDSSVSIDLSSESIDSETSGVEPTYATRLQPKTTPTFVVGDQFQIRTYLTVEPADATLTVTSRSTDVAVVEDDGETITIVGAGSTRLAISSGSKNITLQVKAMSEAQKELDEFAGQITDNYRIVGYEMYLDQNGELITYQEGGQTYNAAFTLNRILTENYIWDDVFTTNYNAILLTNPNTGEKETFGFDLLNDAGRTVSAPENATKLEIGTKVPSAYLTDYFVISKGTLFNISNFTEEGYLDEDTEETRYKFVTSSTQAAVNFLGNLYQFDPSGYGTIETFELEYDAEEQCLDFFVQYPYQENQLDLDDDGVYEAGAATAFSGSIYIDPEVTAIALCDEYIASGEFPAAPDATDVVGAFAPYKEAKNYTMTSVSTLPSYTRESGYEDMADAIDNFVEQYYYFTTTATYTEDAVLITVTYGNPDNADITPKVYKTGYVNKEDGYYKVSQDETTGDLVIAETATGTGTYQAAFASPTVETMQTTGGDEAEFYTFDLAGNINYFTEEVLEGAWFVEGEAAEDGSRTFTGKAGQIAMTTIGVSGESTYFTPASYEGTDVYLAFNDSKISLATSFINYVRDSSGTYGRGTSTYAVEFSARGTTTNAEIEALLEA